MNPAGFEKLVRGLPDQEILSIAVECGFLQNRDIHRGDEVMVPRWLAEILQKKGIVELVSKH